MDRRRVLTLASSIISLTILAACGSPSPPGVGGVIGGNQNLATPTPAKPSGATLAEEDAIGAVRAFLEAPKQKTETRTRRVPCTQYDLDADAYHTRCRQIPGGETFYKTETYQEQVSIPNPCRVPGPNEGKWEAKFYPSSKNWDVKFTKNSGSVDGWTVKDQTREVTSKQPPC